MIDEQTNHEDPDEDIERWDKTKPLMPAPLSQLEPAQWCEECQDWVPESKSVWCPKCQCYFCKKHRFANCPKCGTPLKEEE